MARTRTLLATTAATLAVALLGTGLAVTDTASAAKPKNPAATDFALKGWGYGTAVRGGEAPTGASASAYQSIACTNRVGLEATNKVADATLPGLGTVGAVDTRVWTTRSAGAVSMWAQNTIGKVTLSDSPLGTLVLTAVSTTARAYHDRTGFKSTASTDLAKLQFQPPMGPPMTLDVPKPGKPVEVPGFARVSIAHAWKPKTANGARIFANGLKVKLLSSNTTVQVAHAVAQIGTGLKSGVFAGSSYGVTGSGLSDILALGKNPLLKMPCQGTAGDVKSRQAAGVELGDQIVVGAAKSQELGNQTKRRAWGWERSTVGAINIGDGALKVSGIVGQVRVARNAAASQPVRTSVAGTTLGTILVNGEEQQIPVGQTLEIPGVAKLQPRIVTKIPNGVAVTALRITLLDGSGAVLNLGNAQLQIKHLGTKKK